VFKSDILASSGLRMGLAFCVVLSACTYGTQGGDFDWPAATAENKPWTYWWWHGSAVDTQGLTEHLEAYQQAGLGGVHIIPIYGVKGQEQRFIDYLSPGWMKMYAHTVSEAHRLGMGVDMSTGTGWPFGGPNVGVDDATADVVFKTYSIAGAERLTEKVRVEDERAKRCAELQTLMGFSEAGDVLNLTEKVDGQGNLEWVAPPGRWKLYGVFQVLGGKKVERAAPGAVGYIVDPFSSASLRRYLVRFDKAFAAYKGAMPRSHYHDSYEYGRATWTDDLFAEFQKRRGYDLRTMLPALLGDGDKDVVARVKCDYRETIADLHLEYIEEWAKWCHAGGCLTRNQAHGSPSNLLDTYAASDIPETEIFGPSGLAVPGLRSEPGFDFHAELNNPLMLKFASSAAHVAGKRLTSSETCTWLGEHFKVSLSQAKPEIDQLFVSGINHIFYHGMAYSPLDEPWPGWLFYASTSFAPTNSIWRDFAWLNAYVTRCQSVLQSAEPNNDIVLYWPIYDLWHNQGGMLMGLSVHGISGWLSNRGFYDTPKRLWRRGYCYDYISDRQLAEAKFVSGNVAAGSGCYKLVVVPRCRLMPVRTLRKLAALADAGATIVVVHGLPTDVPGFGNIQKRRDTFRKLLDRLKADDSNGPDFRQVRVGKGRLLLGEDLEKMVCSAHVVREEVVDYGVEFIRRRRPDGYDYFMTNLNGGNLDQWVELSVAGESAVILDPRVEDKSGVAAVKRGNSGRLRCYLQLEPGQSCIVRTFSSRQVEGPTWRYIKSSSRSRQIEGTWQVSFVQGGPELPTGFETDKLASWTQLGDDEAKRFAGTALYQISFEANPADAHDWLLDLGRVCESARVRLNGHNMGCLWSIPFKMLIGRHLRPGRNVLEVEVTNLSANRIADLDRRQVNWKTFYDINFVDIHYHKFDASGWPFMDSGLLGPVCLIPVSYIQPSD